MEDQERRAAPEPAPDVDLVNRFKVRSVIAAAIAGRDVGGREGELVQERCGKAGNFIPYDVLETRQVTTTSTTSIRPINIAPLQGRLFQETAAEFIGVAIPSVPAGVQNWPIMTAGATAATAAEAAAGPAAAAITITTTRAAPNRIQATYLITREAIAQVGPSLESILRQDLSLIHI